MWFSISRSLTKVVTISVSTAVSVSVSVSIATISVSTIAVVGIGFGFTFTNEMMSWDTASVTGTFEARSTCSRPGLLVEITTISIPSIGISFSRNRSCQADSGDHKKLHIEYLNWSFDVKKKMKLYTLSYPSNLDI